jgi:hypothetical protein
MNLGCVDYFILNDVSIFIENNDIEIGHATAVVDGI